MNKKTQYIVVNTHEPETKECSSLEEVKKYINRMWTEGSLEESEISEYIRVFEVKREVNVTTKIAINVE